MEADTVVQDMGEVATVMVGQVVTVGEAVVRGTVVLGMDRNRKVGDVQNSASLPTNILVHM